MGLKDLRSRFDRHNLQDPAVPPAQLSGQTVGGEDGIVGPTPSDGAYFTNNMTSDSPFDTERGPKMDQMVKMMKDKVVSSNHGYLGAQGTKTYGPAPGGWENSPFQDLDGNTPSGYVNPDTGATYGG